MWRVLLAYGDILEDGAITPKDSTTDNDPGRVVD
jgi:hypothetical protein